MHASSRHLSLLAASLVIGLTACDLYPPTPKPDYTIRVIPTANGMTAVPPECPAWSDPKTDPFDGQPAPQFGCTTARNLAMMVERPEDLVQGRDFGTSSGVLAVGAMRRYNNNQTRGLLELQSQPDFSPSATTAPTAASTMTGEAIGSGTAIAAPTVPGSAP